MAIVVKAKLNSLSISPYKVRLVADLVRLKKVTKAREILSLSTKKAAASLLKLIESAVANAKNNFSLSDSELYIQKLTVDEGMALKRWMPRARGRATSLRKRTSNINLILSSSQKENKKTDRENKKIEVKEAEKPTIKEVKKEVKKNKKAD